MKRETRLQPIAKTKALVMVNLKVVVLDTDFYSLQSINSYLAWDRRTRVTYLATTPEDVIRYVSRAPEAELPDVIVIDADHLGGPETLVRYIERLRTHAPRAWFMCLAQTVDPALIDAALRARARGFLLKGEVRMQIAGAIVFSLDKDFVVTQSVLRGGERIFNAHFIRPTLLPGQREYPELTDRVRQAMELCVIKGMPAQLAADEMGISLHTVRSYIKDGYRILEAYDETDYPVDMSPQERAFMRLTSFREET